MNLQKHLEIEIVEIIHEQIKANGKVIADWVANEVVRRHDSIEGDDQGFAKFCMYAHVRRTVQKVAQRYRGTEDDRQLLLPGYDCVQVYYSIVRNGEQHIVAIEQMTVAEVYAKIDELQKMRDGLERHIDELKQYLVDRIEVSRKR